MKSKKYIRIIIVALMLIGAVLIYLNWDKLKKDPTTVENELYNLDIGYSRLRISLPVFVAQEEGFFQKHGIDADLKMYDTAQPLMQAILAGNIDAGGYTALPITYNGMLRSGKQLYFISAMMEDQDHRISYLLRPKSSEQEPPEVTGIKALKGKRIGILPTIAYRAWLEEILRKNDIDPEKDVVIQQIAPAQQPQALKNKAVDALFTNDPAATSAIELGIAELVSDEVESPKYIQSPFVFGSFNVSKDWADQNRDVYNRLILALDEAVEFVNANPDKSKEHMKAYLQESFKDHVQRYPDAMYWDTDKSDDVLFNNIADIYLKIGIIPKQLLLNGLVE